MKKIIFFSGLMLALAACASDPIPPHIQAKVDAIPARQLPANYTAEREFCGSKKEDRKAACREQVRRENAVRVMMREEGSR